MEQPRGDLVRSHVADDVELAGSLFGNSIVCDPLEFRVELLEEIFEQEGEELWREGRGGREGGSGGGSE